MVPLDLDKTTFVYHNAMVSNLHKYRQPELVEAVITQNLQKVQDLLSRGENPNMYEKGGETRPVLAIAASLKSIEIARELINAGANVNIFCRCDRQNPLMKAINNCNLAMVRLLIVEGKADVNAMGHKNDQPALTMVVHNDEQHPNPDNVEIVRCLVVDGKANVNLMCGRTGESAFMVAASSCKAEMIKIMLQDKNLDINLPSRRTRCSALGYALSNYIFDEKNQGMIVSPALKATVQYLIIDGKANYEGYEGLVEKVLNIQKRVQENPTRYRRMINALGKVKSYIAERFVRC